MGTRNTPTEMRRAMGLGDLIKGKQKCNGCGKRATVYANKYGVFCEDCKGDWGPRKKKGTKGAK